MSLTAINLSEGYQKLIDCITNLAWIMDNSGQIYLVNSAWKDYTRRSLDSKENSFFWDFLSLQQRDSIKQQWQQNSAQFWEIEQTLQNAHNQPQLFTIKLELLIPDNNHPLWLGTACKQKSTFNEVNLADYKQKELELQRSTEFVRRILESSKDCIKVIDIHGRLLYMNDGGQDIMEIDDFSKVRYLPWLSFWKGCDLQKAEQAFAKAKAGELGRFDGFCATAKGTPKWWEVIVTPMFDENHQVSEILSVSRNITARKHAEQNLQKRNQELDQFTYMVTHDLKAPLRGISSLSEWIIEDLREHSSAETKHNLKLLRQRVQRMNGLIDGLLKYSRVGREKLPLESVDMNELFQEIIDSLSPPNGFKVINSDILPILQTKRLLINQVLSNLISNAIKHHDKDTGIVELTAIERDNHYEFAIADDGPGIAESERERVFEIFQTLNSRSSTNTGIGLALVKKIIKEEGCQLWLEENTPKGCKFCFTWLKST